MKIKSTTKTWLNKKFFLRSFKIPKYTLKQVNISNRFLSGNIATCFCIFSEEGKNIDSCCAKINCAFCGNFIKDEQFLKLAVRHKCLTQESLSYRSFE